MTSVSILFSCWEVQTIKINFKKFWGHYIPSTIFVYAYRTCFIATVECALFCQSRFHNSPCNGVVVVVLRIWMNFSFAKMASYAEICNECVVWNNVHIPVILPETLLVKVFALLRYYTAFIRSYSTYPCPILGGSAVLDCLIMEDGTYRLSRNSVIN